MPSDDTNSVFWNTLSGSTCPWMVFGAPSCFLFGCGDLEVSEYAIVPHSTLTSSIEIPIPWQLGKRKTLAYTQVYCGCQTNQQLHLITSPEFPCQWICWHVHWLFVARPTLCTLCPQLYTFGDCRASINKNTIKAISILQKLGIKVLGTFEKEHVNHPPDGGLKISWCLVDPKRTWWCQWNRPSVYYRWSGCTVPDTAAGDPLAALQRKAQSS